MICSQSGKLLHPSPKIYMHCVISSIIPVLRTYITYIESQVPCIYGLCYAFLYNLLLTWFPSYLKNNRSGEMRTGTESSRSLRHSVYVSINDSGSLGVKGFRIDLESGNKSEALLLNFDVFAPYPKIGRFKMLPYVLAIILIRSRQSFGFL